jgi:hypothetical protein
MLSTDKSWADIHFQYFARLFAVASRKKGGAYWNYQNKDSAKSRCGPRG